MRTTNSFFSTIVVTHYREFDNILPTRFLVLAFRESLLRNRKSVDEYDELPVALQSLIYVDVLARAIEMAGLDDDSVFFKVLEPFRTWVRKYISEEVRDGL